MAVRRVFLAHKVSSLIFQMTKDPSENAGFASPPCFAHEMELGAEGYFGIDPRSFRDVARWRKAKREELIATRVALPAERRKELSARIAAELDRLIQPDNGTIVSLYWPFRGEPDLRDWMRALVKGSVRVALPVVVGKGRPLIFREWTPAVRLERGVFNIPFPADGEEVTPTVTISPLVGFDPGCYRLGYGGGFYDRTLSALAPRPRVIGVGFPVSAIPTIYPQPHDIPMDAIVTGDKQVIVRGK